MNGHLKMARPLTAYEAGLTPEEREELYAGPSPTPYYHRMSPYAARGAQMRMMSKNPLLALLAASTFNQPKTAMVTVRAFGDELRKITEGRG